MRLLIASIIALLLAGCDLSSILADPRVAQREEDGKAIGGACRHALRGIEDCYSMNEKALKTAVFSGWKEMDQYMRENKIEGQPSTYQETADPVKEEFIEDKKKKLAVNEKIMGDTKTKSEDSKTKPKPAEKAASKPSH
jgi:hypothetical protein